MTKLEKKAALRRNEAYDFQRRTSQQFINRIRKGAPTALARQAQRKGAINPELSPKKNESN